MIYVTKEFLGKIKTLVKEIDTEVAGFIVGDVDDGVLVIKDLIIPEQEVSSADVEFDADQIMKLRMSMDDKEWQRVVGHWHSHIKMGCFWSSTDEALIEQLSKDRKRSVFIVSSMKDDKFECLTRVVLNEPFRLDVDKQPLYVLEDEEKQDEFLAMAKSKLIEKKFTNNYQGSVSSAWPGDKIGKTDWESDGYPDVHVTANHLTVWNFTKGMKKKLIKAIPSMEKARWSKEEGGKYDVSVETENMTQVQILETAVNKIIDEHFMSQQLGSLDDVADGVMTNEEMERDILLDSEEYDLYQNYGMYKS